MKGRGFHTRLGFAAEGLRAAWKTERSFRSHCLTALAVLLFLIAVRPPAVWWALVALSVGLVITLELVNSAVEGVIDLLHPDIHPQIKIIKDMSAGAVLIASGTSVIVGLALAYAVLLPMLKGWIS